MNFISQPFIRLNLSNISFSEHIPTFEAKLADLWKSASDARSESHYTNFAVPLRCSRSPWVDNVAVVEKESLVAFLLIMKAAERYGYTYFCDMFAFDNLGGKHFRFVAVYRIYNLLLGTPLTVVVLTEEAAPIASIQDVYTSSKWAEREAWEMVGVYFSGHRQMQRLLTDYGLKGHPLRRDFPLTGYLESFFSHNLGHVEAVKVEFMQEYRMFEYYNNWKEKIDRKKHEHGNISTRDNEYAADFIRRWVVKSRAKSNFSQIDYRKVEESNNGLISSGGEIPAQPAAASSARPGFFRRLINKARSFVRANPLLMTLVPGAAIRVVVDLYLGCPATETLQKTLTVVAVGIAIIGAGKFFRLALSKIKDRFFYSGPRPVVSSDAGQGPVYYAPRSETSHKTSDIEKGKGRRNECPCRCPCANCRSIPGRGLIPKPGCLRPGGHHCGCPCRDCQGQPLFVSSLREAVAFVCAAFVSFQLGAAFFSGSELAKHHFISMLIWQFTWEFYWGIIINHPVDLSDEAIQSVLDKAAEEENARKAEPLERLKKYGTGYDPVTKEIIFYGDLDLSDVKRAEDLPGRNPNPKTGIESWLPPVIFMVSLIIWLI